MQGDAGAAIWGQLLLIVILTVINAGFAAAEIAVVSLSRSKIEGQAKKGDRKAKKLLKIMNNSSNFLATIQVGITFAGFFASASAATTLASRVEPLFGHVSFAHELAVLLVTVILSYFSLVFGELYPKQVALQMTERVAKAAVGPISVIGVLMRPFVWLLSASTNVLLKLTPIKFSTDQNKVTREEMTSMIESGKQSGAIDADEYEMLEGIISLSNKLAREVMVPRIDAFMVDADQPDETAIDAILSNIYSRIPIYQKDKDNVIGIVHIKNLLRQARRVGFANVRLEDIMTDPLFVPETISIDDLLTEMRIRQQQMGVLLDEYGGVVGLVTIEDLLEEIVGDIDDESDSATVNYTKLDQDDYLINGRMTLSDFNEAFGTSLHAPDVDTIAGYVISTLGAIPNTHKQETVPIPGGTLTTGKIENSRLVNVHLHLPITAATDHPGPAE
ncbi:hemolysin family protein [Lacticaseibacillus jixianensis]|uniref:Hemolysin family protein n=1 Tax=Lacticaseibacillus jixianensis TaxID=2486012 RepID=A0ABW4B9X2_9LACO|nr:hemolysin family protein [Lacticaseibacillus jixianensis]